MGVDKGLIMDFIPQAAATLLGMYLFKLNLFVLEGALKIILIN